MRNLAFFLIIAFTAVSCTRKQPDIPSIIPEPVSIQPEGGQLVLQPSSDISFTGTGAGQEAEFLASMLRTATGYTLKVSEGTSGSIVLSTDTSGSWKPEEYRLEVKRKKVLLTSGSTEGLFRGIQTIRQLFPPEIESDSVVTGFKWTVPCVSIDDYPRFSWRGMHLDVSRHFFSVDFIKRYIDLIAMHKMNIFHFHLVDDQGWRIEIKKYPKLTEVGAWRVDREDKPWGARPVQKPGEKATYGGFYTQEQIKEIVDYAAKRHVTVVPEIEMPAHVISALAAYPEYSCSGGPFTVLPGSVWPISDIYCAGREETFTFLEDVLSEVMELFPSEYIHIGGDEADKAEWKKCPLCQARIKKEGLKDEAELQSYFIRRIEKFISSKGRKTIGWDEILEGGLAPGAAVMSWRGTEGGIAAARAGHQVVMTPVSHCYFNLYQADPATEPNAYNGMITLRKVYEYDPVPSGLTDKEAQFIIGSQGNLWTEFVSTPQQAEYQVVPRISAMAEIVWSPAGARNWDDFNRRLLKLMKHYDEMGINYSKGSLRVDLTPVYDEKTGSILVSLSSEQSSPEIRYTTDGTDPDGSSPLYKEPFAISASATVKAVIYSADRQLGNICEKTLIINKSTGKPVKYNIPCSDKYKGSGPLTLVNGIRGGQVHDDGQWLGYEGTDMDVVIDLGSGMKINKIVAGFLANTNSWIFLPQWVEFSGSIDGKTFFPLGKTVNEIAPADQGKRAVTLSWSGDQANVRFVRVFAKGLGECPPWHPGAGGKAWLFADEIAIE